MIGLLRAARARLAARYGTGKRPKPATVVRLSDYGRLMISLQLAADLRADITEALARSEAVIVGGTGVQMPQLFADTLCDGVQDAATAARKPDAVWAPLRFTGFDAANLSRIRTGLNRRPERACSTGVLVSIDELTG